MSGLLKYFQWLQQKLYFLFCIQNIFVIQGWGRRRVMTSAEVIRFINAKKILFWIRKFRTALWLLYWFSIVNDSGICEKHYYSGLISVQDLTISVVHNETFQEARRTGDCGSSTDWTEVWPGIKLWAPSSDIILMSGDHHKQKHFSKGMGRYSTI